MPAVHHESHNRYLSDGRNRRDLSAVVAIAQDLMARLNMTKIPGETSVPCAAFYTKARLDGFHVNIR